MILSKYIGKTVIGTILIVILVLIAVEVLIEFTHEFPDIGTGYYGWLQVLQYVPMMLPQDVYQLFPMAGLLGSLVGLGVLASHSELIVMRASGMSLLQITLAVLKAALLLTFVMLFIGEILAPSIQHKAMENKSAAISKGQTYLTSQGIWMRSKNDFLHIDTVTPDKHLKSVLRYKFDEQHRLLVASFAEDGSYENGSWIFRNVAETEFFDGKVGSSHFAEQQWDLSLNPRLLGISNIDAEQKSLLQMYKYIKYRKQSGLNAERYEFIFWQRVFQPLAILVMIFLSVPFIFGFLRSQTMGLRIVIGAAFGFGFYMINQFIGPMTVVYHLPAPIVAIMPSIFFAALGYVLLLRVK